MKGSPKIDPYYIYVTLHLLECSSLSFAQEACDIKWDVATEWYEKFLASEFNVGTKSEYDCIVDFIDYLDTQEMQELIDER